MTPQTSAVMQPSVQVLLVLGQQPTTTSARSNNSAPMNLQQRLTDPSHLVISRALAEELNPMPDLGPRLDLQEGLLTNRLPIPLEQELLARELERKVSMVLTRGNTNTEPTATITQEIHAAPRVRRVLYPALPTSRQDHMR